jgi:hypothetical protein
MTRHTTHDTRTTIQHSAHYDNNPSFSDFSPFGGWNQPAIKQYVGDAVVCGAGVDKNWYP